MSSIWITLPDYAQMKLIAVSTIKCKPNDLLSVFCTKVALLILYTKDKHNILQYIPRGMPWHLSCNKHKYWVLRWKCVVLYDSDV